MYWPVDGEEEFGEVTVRLLTTHVFAEYTIRHLRLSKSGEPSRNLTQFHFTAWPDKSVPESPWGLVDLHERVMAAPGSGPLLVHCSAGVGRTGTFIGLCNLLQEAEATGKMDFRSTLWKLRQDRMHTIQTIAQYAYLHKVAFVSHMTAGTTVKVKDMYPSLDALAGKTGGNTTTRSYKQEFEAVLEACAATTVVSSETAAQQEENVYQNTGGSANKGKDRLSNILANKAYRPLLTAEAHQEDSYINAVMVPNLTKDSQDILTQLPLPSTVTDFWRLVTQYSVGLVVAFDVDSKHADETIAEFFPTSETEPFENDRFKVETKEPTDSRLAKEFFLTVHQKIVPGMDSSSSQKKRTLTLLMCKSAQLLELRPESVLELQESIKNRRPGGRSRTIYMCRNGADQSGLMCVQSILLDRLESDQCLTVPLVVGTIKAIRPQVIPTVEQYKCLYHVLKLAHESQNVYGNVGDMPGAS
ncbi:receptor-type tyrosine-protein phosphatase mu [Elysia marginata]|uniref:Receptor-type tyrosine-protein phosphatase mu n=1 Tax=Elysia marginata TaxID=1093978 RepID=A0AAV4H1J9_9GAST|nr:receptor-type tyrosine-protein phosphatase mu [Elysia marginata]